MNRVYLRIEWSVKFRAFGITFGNYADKQIIPLPSVFRQMGDALTAHELYVYHNHGISIVAAIQDSSV